MKTIHKYSLDVTDKQTIEIPSGSQILTVQIQSIYSHNHQRPMEQPCIWVLVTTENKPIKRKFRVFGTGQPIADFGVRLVYIGTFQMQGGNLVFHLFEEI